MSKRHHAKVTAEASSPKCIANPSGPPPEGLQWRYRAQGEGGSKCWHLVRKRNIDIDLSPASMKGRVDTSDRIAAAHAMLISPKRYAPQKVVSASQNPANPSDEPSQTLPETFHSRWSAANSIPTTYSIALETPIASLTAVTRDVGETPDGITRGALTVYPQRYQSTPHKLLVALLLTTMFSLFTR